MKISSNKFRQATNVSFLALLSMVACKPDSQNEVTETRSVETVTSVEVGAVIERYSEYIPLPDGVLIAAEIYLPAKATRAENIPAIVEFTRYWRAMDITPEPELPAEISQSLAAGYAYVIVDVRGTGASQGVRKSEFSLAEARDMPDVVEWISRQDWSNGKVASMGVSYSGNTAEMAALFRHPALVAAIPRFTDFDWYTNIVAPGGLKNAFITVRWGKAVRMLDLNDSSLFGEHEGEVSADNPLIKGVLPVDSDTNGSVLAAASLQHSDNASLADYLDTLVYRDEYPMADNLEASGDKATSVHSSRQRYEETGLPMYQWGSWFDAGTAAGILARFNDWDVPYRFVIGAWSHGAGHDANPYAEKDRPAQPSVEEQYTDIFIFLEPYTKSTAVGENPIKQLTYYTVGEDVWKSTDVWPPVGQQMQRWYLQENNGMSPGIPDDSSGFDEYIVDFEAGSGESSRLVMDFKVDRVVRIIQADADQRLLTYTTAPIAEDMELTGSAVVSISVSSSHEDGAFIFYLEDVAPDGYVRMLSEGQLRAVHRATSNEITHETFGPFHSFMRKDGLPLVPGEITNISIALSPVSALVRKGHRIRLAIAGHDKDTFIRVPETGDPVINVYREATKLSWVDLPVILSK